MRPLHSHASPQVRCSLHAPLALMLHEDCRKPAPFASSLQAYALALPLALPFAFALAFAFGAGSAGSPLQAF